MEIRFSKQAQKDIQKIPHNIQVLIKNALQGLKENPPKGDIKTLQGFSDGRRRLRVGKCRIIYQYRNDGNIYIWLIEIGSRGDIYK